MSKLNFESLTQAEQRVVIAKDLIARLEAKKFIARSGTYLDVVRGDLPSGWSVKDAGREVRDVLQGRVCRGCQIGGLFLCAVDRRNKLKLADIGHLDNNDSGMRHYLRQWFTDNELAEVERAFEGWRLYEDWAADKSDADRMALIAKNIIKNKGKFIGKQLIDTGKV